MFADDTNIFVADKCKTTVYETANSVLNLIYKYMKCNLLHINYKKCCFIHFSPNRNDRVPNNGTMLLTLNGLVIKRVKETKFLGVIIDEMGCTYKLKCEIGKLNRIKKCIPKIAHKELFHTLFESP